MKRKSFPIVLALIVLLFSSLNCMAASAFFPPTVTPTATFTQTPTVTPSPTPTLTPTFAPTPTPDISSAELQITDLPAGFSTLSYPTGSADPSLKWFEYGDSSPLQIIVGAVQPLKQNDQFDFDTMIKNPDLLLQSINAGAGKTVIKNLKPLSGLDQFGDASNGFTGVTTSNGITLQADIFLIRKGSVGVFLLSMYPKGQEPAISTLDLAKILNQRESQFPISAFSG